MSLAINQYSKNNYKVLFIGACFVLQGTKFLPKILNSINNAQINIDIVYVQGGNINFYIKYFNDALSDVIKPPKNYSIKHYNNRVNNNFVITEQQNISIYDALKSNTYDAICIACLNPAHYVTIDVNLTKKYLSKYLKLIKKYSNAPIYIYKEPILGNSKKYKIQLPTKTNEELFKIISNNMLKLSAELNFNYIPTLECFNLLKQTKLNNYYGLLKDGVHLDPYIGSYVYNACNYYSLFYKWTQTKLSDIKVDIPIKESNKQYRYNGKLVDCYAVPITEENKAIVDNIVEAYYNIK